MDWRLGLKRPVLPFWSLMLVLAVAGLPLLVRAQVVEEMVLASGSPQFGKKPLICGDTVIWKRYSARPATIGTIQGINLSRRTETPLDILAHWANSGGDILTREYLFFSGQAVPESTPGVRATPLAALRPDASRPTFVVSSFGVAIAANGRFVFMRESQFLEASPHRGQIFAKPLDGLQDPETLLRFIVHTRDEPLIGRTVAASERYFVWIDRDRLTPPDTWKIYARPIDDLFNPDAERLVYDTRVVDSAGTPLHAHDRYVVVKTTDEAIDISPTAIVLVDIEGEQEPIVLAREPNVERLVSIPAISEHYAIWTEIHEDFSHHIVGQRLESGRPVGEEFPIGQGDWANIDRNIVVANGGLFLIEAGLVSTGIVAFELELPGADDVGDVNADGALDVSDPVALLNYLFQGGWRPRLRLADANGNGALDLTDAVVILNHLFLGGPRPGA